MALLPPDIDFKLDKSASPERMNRAMAALDGRLKSLETYRPNFDALLLELQQVGLSRISDAIVPIVEGLAAIQALGFLNAPIAEGTTAQFQLGTVSVTIAQDRRGFFTPSPWLMMMSDANPNDYVLGKLVSYNQTTGALTLNVTNLWGTTSVFSDVTVWGVAGAALSTIESLDTNRGEAIDGRDGCPFATPELGLLWRELVGPRDRLLDGHTRSDRNKPSKRIEVVNQCVFVFS